MRSDLITDLITDSILSWQLFKITLPVAGQGNSELVSMGAGAVSALLLGPSKKL
jgi:hypothetical protein